MKKVLYLILTLSLCQFKAQVNLTSNLKVCMPLDGTANDLSGNGNNGTVSNATLTTDRFGNANKAYLFDRVSSSNITIASFMNLAPTNELTISMWAKKSGLTTSSCLFVLDPDNQNDRCVGCAQYASGLSSMMIWDYGDISSTGGRSEIQSIPADTTWHHYVYLVSQSGNLKQAFLDGNMNLSTNYSLTCTNKNLPFRIGGGFSTGTTNKIMWTGSIDEVYIYNRALTTAEVSALFAGTKVCSTVSGINELSNIENMVVYSENSQNDVYTVHSNKVTADSRLEVYTTDGKLIKQYLQAANNTMNIDLRGTAPGIYLVKLITDSGEYVRKIIK